MTWRNRIVRSGEIKARDYLDKVNHLRIHPESQRKALTAVLGDVGLVDRVLISERSGLVIDGRLRVEEGAKVDAALPADWLDLTEQEEAKILATFDYITT